MPRLVLRASPDLNVMKSALSLSLCAAALTLLCASAQAQSASTYSRPHPSLPLLRVPDALGVNIHFTQEKPGEAKMIADGGFRVIRMDFTWSSIEREKGVYDWSAYDRLAETLAQNKLKPYFILDYGNTLYSPSSTGHPATDEADTPAFRAAFAKWAAASVARFKNRGIIWEIWNEPNIAGFWKPKPDVAAYSRLALEATRAIKAVAPQECIIGPATSTIDLAFLEGCFKAGLLQHWDAVSVHPYRQSVPESSNSEYRELRRLIEQYNPPGKAMPILSGEWGYSSAWGEYDEERQGKYLPRQWMTNLLNRVPVSIWYDWHDDGLDPKEPEHHFGTVQHPLIPNRATPYDPKPAYLAAQTMYRQLDGFEFSKRLWTGREDEWVMLWTRGAGNALQVKIAAWVSEGTSTQKPQVSPRTLALPASSGSFAVVDHLGASKPDIRAEKNKLLFSVSDSVSYISPRSPNALWQRAAKWSAAPLERWVRAPYEFEAGQGPSPSAVSTGANRRDEEEKAPGRLLRDSEPFQLVTRDGRDRSNSFAQVTHVAVANPLQVLAQAGEAPGSISVRLRASGGEAEKGSVRVSVAGQKPLTLPYTLAAGEKETRLQIPISLKPETRVSVVALDSRGRPSVRARLLRFVSLDSFARAGADSDFAALGDGDAKIASTQSLSVAQAPTNLGGQAVRALKLSYKWDAGWKFVRVLPPASLKIEGKPQALQMWIHGDGQGNVARLRVRDESGQTFQPNGDPQEINWKGWKLVTFALDGTNAGHWGGANDGIVHGSLAWDSVFLLDSANRTAQSGEIYLANPTLVYEDEPEARTDR